MPSARPRVVLIASVLAGCGSATHRDTSDPGDAGPDPSPGLDAAAVPDAAPSPPHVVAACNGLPPGGTWDLVSPAAWAASPKNEALSVVVNPRNTSEVFAVAGDKTSGGKGGTGIYRSGDCGATWAKVSTGRNGALLETGDVWQLQMDPTDPQVLYASNGYGGPPSLFKSTDGGVDWDVLMPDKGALAQAIGGNFVQEFALDPKDPHHLVVTFHFTCKGEFASGCLAESKDAGATWRPVKGPASGWQEGAGPVILGGAAWLYASGNGVWYTGDAGASWQKVGASGSGRLYRSRDGTQYLGGGFGSARMLRSSDGQTWTPVVNAPRAYVVIGTGTDLYAGFVNDYSGQPFYTAKEGDPTTWTRMKTPAMRQGPGSLAYDPDHHLLYAPCWGAGLWRLVTP